MKKITILFLILTSFIGFSQSYSGPESVEYDYANSRWLIANTSSHQVLARNSAGVLTVFATLTGSGPYGIEIMDGVLYCCNGGFIRGYNLSSGANVFNLDLSASFLNGITHDSSGNLYATDFSAKKVFKINVVTSAFSAIASNLVQSPNGIVFDQANNRCVFANWGSNAPIKAINVASFAVTTLLTTSNSNIDGIAIDAFGNFYISTWGSQNVVRYDNAFANSPVSIATGLNNPADIFVNVVDNVLGIPNSGNNTVTFVNLVLGMNTFNENWLKTSSVSPNPVVSNSVFKFELNSSMKVAAEIVSIEGKIVQSIDFSTEYLQSGTINLNNSNLKSGVYYLVFKADAYSKTIPILIK